MSSSFHLVSLSLRIGVRTRQSALHIAAAMGYAPVVARILHLRGTAELRDHRKQRPLDYAQGQVRWLLQRFSGREPALEPGTNIFSTSLILFIFLFIHIYRCTIYNIEVCL